MPPSGGKEDQEASLARTIRAHKLESAVFLVTLLASGLLMVLFQDPIRLLAVSSLVGMFGASVIVFATYVGLKDFEELPKRIYTPVYLVLYILIGGILAAVLQSTQLTNYTPIQAFTVGAAWPAVVQGMNVTQKAKQIAEEQTKDYQNTDSQLAGLGE